MATELLYPRLSEAPEPRSTSLVRSGVARGDHAQAGERGVELGERLEPALLAGGRQMLGEPLADLESRPSRFRSVRFEPVRLLV
jgi:hypothetical protein